MVTIVVVAYLFIKSMYWHIGSVMYYHNLSNRKLSGLLVVCTIDVLYRLLIALYFPIVPF